LYNKSTHFILELLQNADDNQYDGVVPRLCITYKPGSLRIDCNEVGFSDRNVEAICAIGGSTKSGSNVSTGEKGIGFKSVFRVADAVWISSREYSFKLDTREDGELGMIAPRWDAFPEPLRNGHSSLFLKLSDRYNEDELIEEISSLDPALLIFLRRLQHVELHLVSKDGQTWSTNLSRVNKVQGGLQFVTIAHERATVKYVTRKHTVRKMPPESKRLSVSQSEIVLAFPIADANEEPLPTTHQVYAFLPIREFGFKVVAMSSSL
jgi:hypothetical protein